MNLKMPRRKIPAINLEERKAPPKFRVVICRVCGKSFQVTEAEYQSASYYAEYILKAFSMAALQAGDLCPNCREKPLNERIVNK